MLRNFLPGVSIEGNLLRSLKRSFYNNTDTALRGAQAHAHCLYQSP